MSNVQRWGNSGERPINNCRKYLVDCLWFKIGHWQLVCLIIVHANQIITG
uniref:Uncharacterized protein n=1 Tax=Rhizophora mucronata TaxID=61149 RepID=A0A2P2P8L2_RHIMU